MPSQSRRSYLMSLYRYLFDRDDFPRLSPSQKVVSVRIRRKKVNHNEQSSVRPGRKQLRLFIETSTGLAPAFIVSGRKKKPGRKPKQVLPRHRPQDKDRSELWLLTEFLLTKEELAMLEKEKWERAVEVRAGWSAEERAKRIVDPVERAALFPITLEAVSLGEE